MNRKIASASATAFALGLVLVHFYLRQLERETSGGALVGVLVALQDLAPGGVLTEDAIGIRHVPEAYVDGRRIRASEASDVLGVPVTTAVSAGEAIVWSDLAGATLERRQLSGLVGEGMRAVTITSKMNVFEGLLRPGDRVDVLVTLVEESGPRTYTLLQNVMVLSVGGDLGGPLRETSRGGGSVNVSVGIADAHALAQAEQRGRLKLVLRNPSDVEILSAAPLPSGPGRPGRSTGPELREIEHVR